MDVLLQGSGQGVGRNPSHKQKKCFRIKANNIVVQKCQFLEDRLLVRLESLLESVLLASNFREITKYSKHHIY